MEQIIEGLRYDTGNAALLADDRYWDGSNFDRNGRNKYLYRTPKGRFFVYHTSRWQGEFDHIQPVDELEAREAYESLKEKHVSYREAFGEDPEEA